MLACTENGIKVISGAFSERKIVGAHSVLNKDVFDVFPYVGPLDVEGIKIRHSHNNDIGIHLHHEGNKPVLADVVRSDPGLLLAHGEDVVIGI